VRAGLGASHLEEFNLEFSVALRRNERAWWLQGVSHHEGQKQGCGIDELNFPLPSSYIKLVLYISLDWERHKKAVSHDFALLIDAIFVKL
jgi:hypothetical protein